MESLFLDICFPKGIFPFYQSAIEFFTIIQTAKNGCETRLILNEIGRNKYEAHNLVVSKSEARFLSSFFHLAKGRGKSFRFKDELNFVAQDEILIPEQNKAQLFKTFTFDKFEYRKLVKFPLENSLCIYQNKNEILEKEKDYTLVPNSGIIDFKFNTQAKVIKANFEFNIETRFDQDELLFTIDNNGRIIIPKLFLVEII